MAHDALKNGARRAVRRPNPEHFPHRQHRWRGDFQLARAAFRVGLPVRHYHAFRLRDPARGVRRQPPRPHLARRLPGLILHGS